MEGVRVYAHRCSMGDHCCSLSGHLDRQLQFRKRGEEYLRQPVRQSGAGYDLLGWTGCAASSYNSIWEALFPQKLLKEIVCLGR